MLAQKEQNNSEASLALPMTGRQWVEQKPCCLLNRYQMGLTKEEKHSTTINDESNSELLYSDVHQCLGFFSVVVTAGSPLSRKGFI